MKTQHHVALIAVACSLLLTFVHIDAQEKTIGDSLYSQILHEQRSIKIHLPESYKSGSPKKYDVIYMTDGEWILDNFSFIYDFAQKEKFVPEAILVAIPNRYIDGTNQRDRDFLARKTPRNALAGGADAFIGFVKTELMPYIDKHYPTSGDNSLYGHSFGGLFSMYVLLTQPDLFSTYYCSDPSFWWDDNYMNALAAATFDSVKVLNKTLWINGITETFKGMGINVMDSILAVKAPKGLRWHIGLFPNESHNSVRLKGIYDGIKFVHDGFNTAAIAFHPMNGVLLKGVPTKIFMAGRYPNLHYTIDGTEPDTTSPKITEAMFDIPGPGVLKVQAFGKNTKYASKGEGIFERGDVVPALPNLQHARQGGLRYAYYEGAWDSLPDFSTLTPVSHAIADSNFNLTKLKSNKNFGCVAEGYLKIEKSGYYILALDSDDGARLSFNGKKILDNDGLHATGNAKSYILPLEQGFYPLKIEYFQKEGGLDLQLMYVLPGDMRPMTIPYSAFYYTE